MTTTTPRPTEADVFAELVYDDVELVRAEFDALIAACWESPSEPPLGKPCPPDGGWAGRPPLPIPRRPGLPAAPALHRPPEGRQRGPPPRRSVRSALSERS
jgi:hypothetical protein